MIKLSRLIRGLLFTSGVIGIITAIAGISFIAVINFKSRDIIHNIHDRSVDRVQSVRAEVARLELFTASLQEAAENLDQMIDRAQMKLAARAAEEIDERIESVRDEVRAYSLIQGDRIRAVTNEIERLREEMVVLEPLITMIDSRLRSRLAELDTDEVGSRLRELKASYEGFLAEVAAFKQAVRDGVMTAERVQKLQQALSRTAELSHNGYTAIDRRISLLIQYAESVRDGTVWWINAVSIVGIILLVWFGAGQASIVWVAWAGTGSRSAGPTTAS